MPLWRCPRSHGASPLFHTFHTLRGTSLRYLMSMSCVTSSQRSSGESVVKETLSSSLTRTSSSLTRTSAHESKEFAPPRHPHTKCEFHPSPHRHPRYEANERLTAADALEHAFFNLPLAVPPATATATATAATAAASSSKLSVSQPLSSQHLDLQIVHMQQQQQQQPLPLKPLPGGGMLGCGTGTAASFLGGDCGTGSFLSVSLQQV